MGAPSEGLPPNMGLLGSLPAMESNTKMMGLVASQDLPKGFVLGPLCGYLMPAHIAAAELEEVPMNQDLKCTQERWRFECARWAHVVRGSRCPGAFRGVQTEPFKGVLTVSPEIRFHTCFGQHVPSSSISCVFGSESLRAMDWCMHGSSRTGWSGGGGLWWSRFLGPLLQNFDAVPQGV
eukprot:scaffold249745_cov17-Tisochrysis_lutea.AAC.1